MRRVGRGACECVGVGEGRWTDDGSDFPEQSHCFKSGAAADLVGPVNHAAIMIADVAAQTCCALPGFVGTGSAI